MGMGGRTFSSDDVVIKSPNDRRLYRLIELENGLRALLVHDPEIYPEGPPKAVQTDDEEDEEEEGDEDDEGDEDEEDESEEGDEDECEEEDGEGDYSEAEGKGTKAAAQTKKVAYCLIGWLLIYLLMGNSGKKRLTVIGSENTWKCDNINGKQFHA